MKRTVVYVLMVAFALGCVVTAISPFVFVYETENAHSQLITYEKGLPFPYVIETARVVRERRVDWSGLVYVPHYYTRTVEYEILVIPLLSSVLSNTVAVAGIIGIILIRAKQSSLRGYRLRDQLGTKTITQFRSVKGEGTDS